MQLRRRDTPNRRNIKPETAKERLAEIMIRLFGLDIQIDTLDFACYMDFMLNEPHAQTMPWKLRHEKIMEQYGMDIAEITLRRWTNRLIEHGVVFLLTHSLL